MMKHKRIYAILLFVLFISTLVVHAETVTKTYEPLIGRWVRPDGGYVLVIEYIYEDGSLDALYLNPRSINVSKAQVSVQSGRIDIFVELRDVGYPGSYYTLRYEPKSDRLIGVYHQLVTQQNFDIYFARE